MVAGSVVRFASHADLPAEAAADLPALRELGVRSLAIVPLTISGAVVRALSFATVREERDWPEALVPRIALLGEVLASVLARDEAHRREQEARAQAAHATRVGAMGAFAASLAHELTQPLAASLANAETGVRLLAAPEPDLDELRATLADIVADERRAGDLVQKLRRFLRRGEVERGELDLREVLEEVLQLVGREAQARGVRLRLEIAEALPKIVGDRVQLQQVVLNLLSNAIDAVAAGDRPVREVAVLAGRCGDGVSVEVRDSGAGMDARNARPDLPAVLHHQAEGDGARTLDQPDDRGGARRNALGALRAREGVHLPDRAPPAAVPAHRLTAPADAAGTVFVIDDDPSVRRALERQLRTAGFRVETFESAQDYVARAPRTAIACIVTDVRMPGMSGLDLQDSLAQAGGALPMVFITGHGDIPTTVRAMKGGAVDFLPKPFAEREILAAVAEALERSRAIERERREIGSLRARYEALTAREQEVLALVVAGLLNKVIADRLGIQESTIKVHRGRVMEKMDAASVADLVRMSERLGLAPDEDPARR